MTRPLDRPDVANAAATKRGSPLVVIQSHPVWLPQTQTWMYNLVRHLPADLVESHIVCDRTENLGQFALSNIHCLTDGPLTAYIWEKGLRKLGVKRDGGLLARVAKNTSAQVLHSHFGPVGWTNLAAAKRAGLRHVVAFYGFDVSRLPAIKPTWVNRYQRLFSEADVFLCEGPHMAGQLVNLGCPPAKVRVLHLGVDVDAIPYRPRQWAPGTPLRVLLAGTFREKKGIPYALKALSAIRREVEVEITIIGEATSGSRDQAERTRILRTIESSNLQPATQLLGFRPHAVLMEEAYRHDIFISPSVSAVDGDNEGGAPVTITEMMASGMPVVSTRHCDIPEVVTYGGKDWLAEERNADALADRVRWLVQHSDSWLPMLDEGRERASVEFNAKVQAGKLEAIYKSVIA